jgi:hypothetical protein
MDLVEGPSSLELYHGTAASGVESIRATGLFPPEPPRYPGYWAMLTSSWDDAVGTRDGSPWVTAPSLLTGCRNIRLMST